MPVEKARRKPSQDRAIASVEAILEATARILVEEGYARASTNRIAKRAGVSVGTLYQYFPNKEAIVEALVERLAERQLDVLAEQLRLHSGLGLEPATRGLIQAMIAAQRVDTELSHALITQCPVEGALNIDRRWKRRMTELLGAYMLARQADLAPRNVQLAAYVLVHALFAVVHDTLEERPELVANDALTDELVDLTLGYLRPGGR